MTTIATSLRSDVSGGSHLQQAANGLALVRVTVGAMLVWVFFENLGTGLYTPAGSAVETVVIFSLVVIGPESLESRSCASVRHHTDPQ